MATLQRTSISEFALRNPIYAAAEVSFYTIDDDGVKTTTLATLYEAATGSETLDNPQTLDGTGKFLAPVYVAEPVIAVVESDALGTEETGIIAGNLAGEAAVTAGAARDQALSYMAEADRIRKATEEAGLVLPLEIADMNVSGFIATLLDDPDAATARQTLGVNAGTSTGTAGEAITVNATNGLAAVYFDTMNDRGNGVGDVHALDCDATGPSRIGKHVGILTSNASANDTITVTVGAGLITGLANLTANADIWAHPNVAGAITQTAPPIPGDGNQSAVIPLGRAVNASAMWFQPPGEITIVKHHDSLANNTGSNVSIPTDTGAMDRQVAAYLTTGGTANVSSGTNVAAGYTGGGGANAAFDGNTAQNSTQGAFASATSSGYNNYVGKSGLANLTITGATIIAATNNGFVNGIAAGYAVMVSTDGGGNFTNVATGTSNGASAETLNENFAAVANVTDIRWVFNGNGVNGGTVAELTVRQSTGGSRQEPITVQGATYATGNVIAVRHDDGTGNGSDNTTNFKNVTGAAINVTFEVVL